MKNLHLIAILLTALSTSGCLHIIEEITLKKDGSGTYRFMVDASEIQKMTKSLTDKSKASEKTDSIPFDREIKFDTTAAPKKEHELTVERLAAYPGLSSVVAINDSAHFITGFAFDFNNIESLETAMESIGAASSLGAWSESSNMSWSKKLLKRDRGGKSFRDIISSALSERGEAEGREMSGMEGIMKMMLGSLSFKQVYHFPDQKIKKCNHKGAQISQDRHFLTIIENPFSDKEAQKAPAELQVRLK